jgi:branched-chain amino acid transport system permease protein
LSLNLLLGVTGLVSFGHVAYFGVGAYVCALLMKSLGWPFSLAFPAAGLGAGLFALVFGYFCVRLTKIYFAMLTLAFSQIVWAICFKWNDVTGGDQGLPDVPFPDLGWMSSLPGFGHFRVAEEFYFLVLILVMLCVAALRRLQQSPFGRVLTTIRENPERAAFVGVNVRAYELAAFTAAGVFAGFSGALFGIFNRGVFADYVFWSKSADVMIMTILGGMNHFWGPMVGAAVLTILNQQITSYTEYWPFFLGTILVVLLFGFPGGIMGALDAGWTRLTHRRRDA